MWYLHVMIEIYTCSCKTDHFFQCKFLIDARLAQLGEIVGSNPGRANDQGH